MRKYLMCSSGLMLTHRYVCCCHRPPKITNFFFEVDFLQKFCGRRPQVLGTFRSFTPQKLRLTVFSSINSRATCFQSKRSRLYLLTLFLLILIFCHIFICFSLFHLPNFFMKFDQTRQLMFYFTILSTVNWIGFVSYQLG